MTAGTIAGKNRGAIRGLGSDRHCEGPRNRTNQAGATHATYLPAYCASVTASSHLTVPS